MDMCWPIGRPKMESGLGNLNRYLAVPGKPNSIDRSKVTHDLHSNIVRNKSLFFKFKFLKDVRLQDLGTSFLCVLNNMIRYLLYGIQFGSWLQLQGANFELGKDLMCFIRVASAVVGFCSILASNFKQKFCATAVSPQISLDQDDCWEI